MATLKDGAVSITAESSRDSSAVEGSPALGPVAILHIRCHGNASSLSSLPSLLPLPYLETDNLLSLRSMGVFFNLERMSVSLASKSIYKSDKFF